MRKRVPRQLFWITLLVLATVLGSMGANLLNWIGIAFYKFDQPRWAKVFYHLALEARPSFLSALHNVGLLEKDQGDFYQAEQIYQRIISARPHWGLVHKSLGACLQLQGKVREAKREYLRALALDPRLGSAWNNLGVIYFYEGKMRRARICYEEALHLDPEDRITLSNYQRLNLKSGEA